MLSAIDTYTALFWLPIRAEVDVYQRVYHHDLLGMMKKAAAGGVWLLFLGSL